jgi:hypothetical protein
MKQTAPQAPRADARTPLSTEEAASRLGIKAQTLRAAFCRNVSSSTFFDGLMFTQFDGATDVCGQKPAASHHGCWREMPHQQP